MKHLALLLLFVLIFSAPALAQETKTEISGLEVTTASEDTAASDDLGETEEFETESTVSDIPASAETAQAPAEVALEAQGTAGVSTGLSSSPSVAEAEQLFASGDAEKARELLKTNITTLTGAELDGANDLLARINYKLLTEGKGNFQGLSEYEVKSGDSLYVIAKKNKTTPDSIIKLNNLKGSTIFPGQKLKIMSAAYSISVSKSKNRLELFLGDDIIKTYRVATGTNNSTPVGTFTITTKLENPTWYKTGAVVAPGSKDNILGTRWLGFSKPGFGIHGTTIPESIGTQSTAGCVRMRNEEVEELYALVPSGAQVTIVD